MKPASESDHSGVTGTAGDQDIEAGRVKPVAEVVAQLRRKRASTRHPGSCAS